MPRLFGITLSQQADDSMGVSRIVIGYVLAPFAGALSLVLLTAINGSLIGLSDLPGLIMLYGLPPHLLGTITWMPPVLKSARRFHRLVFLFAGAACGAVVALVFATIFQLVGGAGSDLYLTLAVSGAMSALTFREIGLS